MTSIFYALDLSTKPGWAVFHMKDGKVDHFKFDTIFPDKNVSDFGEYPFNFVRWADYISGKVILLLSLSFSMHPDLEVIIEETNAGKNPYSQKILEFIHYGVIKGCREHKIPIKYIRTGVWRKIVGANMNAEEKNLNARIRRIKKSTGKKLAKIEGKVVGKRTRKHAALRCFKEHFGYDLPLKMEDACEAVLIGLAYTQGASICDGTVMGGTGR